MRSKISFIAVLVLIGMLIASTGYLHSPYSNASGAHEDSPYNSQNLVHIAQAVDSEENQVNGEIKSFSKLQAALDCEADYCVNEGDSLTFQISCTIVGGDPTGAVITCKMLSGPPGATFSSTSGQSAIGTFVWNNAGPEGTYQAQFQSEFLACPPRTICHVNPPTTFTIKVTKPSPCDIDPNSTECIAECRGQTPRQTEFALEQPKVQFAAWLGKSVVTKSSSDVIQQIAGKKCPYAPEEREKDKEKREAESKTQTDDVKIKQGVERVVNDPNKMKHIFDPAQKHFLEPFVEELGSQKAVIEEVVSEIVLNQKLPDGIYSKAFPKAPATAPPATIPAGSGKVVFEGSIVNGVPQIGTLYAAP